MTFPKDLELGILTFPLEFGLMMISSSSLKNKFFRFAFAIISFDGRPNISIINDS